MFSECYGTGALIHSGDHRPRLPVHPQPPERPGTRWAECHDGQRGRPAQHHPGCMERGGRAGWHATEACWQLHHQDCQAPAPVPQALLQWHRRSSSLAAAHGLSSWPNITNRQTALVRATHFFPEESSKKIDEMRLKQAPIHVGLYADGADARGSRHAQSRA